MAGTAAGPVLGERGAGCNLGADRFLQLCDLVGPRPIRAANTHCIGWVQIVREAQAPDTDILNQKTGPRRAVWATPAVAAPVLCGRATYLVTWLKFI